MEGTEDHEKGLREESGNKEGATRVEKPDIDASETGKGESSGRRGNGESHQSAAIDDPADDYNHEDDSADETQQPTHQPSTGAGKSQTKRADRRTGQRISLTMEELKEEWSIQQSEINSLDERKKRAQEELDSLREQNEAERDALLKDLSDVKKCKKQVELDKEELEKALDACILENERLKNSADDLRQRLQECVAQVSQQMSARDGLTKINEGLHRDLDMARVELKRREKAVEDFKAQTQRFTADEMRHKVLKEVVERLNKELSRAGKQNEWLRAQLRDMTTELPEHPAVEREDGRASASLDDEAQTFIADAEGEERSALFKNEDRGSEGFGTPHQDEEAEQIYSDAAKSTPGTQALGPDTNADKTSTDMQTFDVPSAASTQTQEPKVEADEATAGAQRVTSTSPKGERSSEGSISSPNTIETGDTSKLGAEIEAEKLEVSNESVQPANTPGMQTDLRLSEKHLASPISGMTVKGTGPLSAAGERTPELTNERLVPSPGSPVWVPRTARLNFRFGTAEAPALDSVATKIEKEPTSKNSSVGDTDGNRTENGGQQEDQSTQTRTIDGNMEEGKAERGIAARIPHSSIAWWMLLLGLAFAWWLSEDHKQLWMQANEMTRQVVTGLRDERWAEPRWLARMSFTAENVLQIDRSVFA